MKFDKLKFNKSIFGSLLGKSGSFDIANDAAQINLTRYSKSSSSIKKKSNQTNGDSNLRRIATAHNSASRRKSVDSSKTPIYEEIVIDSDENISIRSSHDSFMIEKLPGNYESDKDEDENENEEEKKKFNAKTKQAASANNNKLPRMRLQQQPRVEKIIEASYDTLDLNDEAKRADLKASNDETKLKSNLNTSETAKLENQDQKLLNNSSSSSESSENNKDSKEINKAVLNTKMRSKSLHVNSASILRKQSTKLFKGIDEIGPDVKRRNIIDVLRQFDLPDEYPMSQSNTNLKAEVDSKFNTKGFDSMVNTGTIKNHATHFSDNFNSSDNNNNNNIHSTFSNFNNNYSPKFEEHIEKENVKKKKPPKIAVGVSIIYGMFLASLGIFLSLDSLSGKIGSEGRIPFAIFFVFLYSVSIVWILFLFFDIRYYLKKLNRFIEKSDTDLNQNKFDTSFSLGPINRTLMNARDVYGDIIRSKMTRDKIKEEGIYTAAYDTVKKGLIDYDKDYFSGYLVDKSQPYNMYLRAGIGAFCMVTLLQCCIQIAEGFENFSQKRSNCDSEMYDALIATLQFIFCCLQFLFIFLRGNIVICSNNSMASVLTMHLAVTNLIVWVNNILMETLHEYYEHVLEENLHAIGKYFDALNGTIRSVVAANSRASSSSSSLSVLSDGNLTDCHDYNLMNFKSYVTKIIPYLYPASIEFSITCATIFIIMWHKIGKTHRKHYALLPTKQNFDGVGNVKMPYSNQFIMLDCTKTSKGLFFGILVFVCTFFSFILFIVYNGDEKTKPRATVLSEITEIGLLIMSLVITCLAFVKVRRKYLIVVPQSNTFDIVLEIVSLCGVYAYSVNSMVAILYSLIYAKNQNSLSSLSEWFFGAVQSSSKSYATTADQRSINGSDLELVNRIAAACASLLTVIQSTIQTLFILECLRRYAAYNSEFMHKPARELITALLLTNLSLWFFDTFSAKRFQTKPFLIEHFGILKWSIINAFSSPLAIFYRFHSSVCLSDIWYGLYYGEYEAPEEEHENEIDLSEEILNEQEELDLSF